jgi:ATP/ADP translocase
LQALLALLLCTIIALIYPHRDHPQFVSFIAITNVLPIHIVPMMYVGLYWRELRPEAALAGTVRISAGVLLFFCTA